MKAELANKNYNELCFQPTRTTETSLVRFCNHEKHIDFLVDEEKLLGAVEKFVRLRKVKRFCKKYGIRIERNY